MPETRIVIDTVILAIWFLGPVGILVFVVGVMGPTRKRTSGCLPVQAAVGME
jgi:hypothetical protein